MTSNDTPTASSTAAGSADAPRTRQDRYDRGMTVFSAVNGAGGARAMASLNDISPELGHQVVAWAFGDVYARPQLPPRDRQLVILGILTALGGCEPQLEVHIETALNVGLTPEEIVEALLQSAVYCGMPKALNATFAAKRVFAERGLLPVNQQVDQQ
jgi:4-carboxymuconolactone decarboxylase